MRRPDLRPVLGSTIVHELLEIVNVPDKVNVLFNVRHDLRPN